MKLNQIYLMLIKKTVESRIRQNINTTAVPLDETHLDAVRELM